MATARRASTRVILTLGVIAAGLFSCQPHHERPTAPALFADAAPLSPAAEQRAAAAAIVLGLVEYFYPNQQAVPVDWNTKAVELMKASLDAGTASRFALRAREVLGTLAPEIEFTTATSLPGYQHRSAPRASSVQFWEHRGFGVAQGSGPFRSRLIRATPEKAPLRLGTWWRETLPIGLDVEIPLAGIARPLSPPRSHADGRGPTSLAPSGGPVSLQERLAVVAVAWNAIRYFDPLFLPTLDTRNAVLQEALASAALATTAKAVDNAVLGMLTRIGDGHGNVSRGQEYTGRLPVAWKFLEDGSLIVTGVPADSPLRLGDRVLNIDGRPVEDLVRDLSPAAPAAGSGWQHFRISLRLRLGQEGDTITLKIERRPAHVFSVVHLALAPIASPSAQVLEPRPIPIAALPGGVTYIDLTRVEPERIDKYLPRLASAPSLILDMRGYPNVPIDFLCHLSGEPLPSPRLEIPLLHSPADVGLSYKRVDWQMNPCQPRLKASTVVLTDGRAISAAETALSMIKEQHLATVVGEPTAGTNGNVARTRLPAGFALVFTGMRVLNQDGSQFRGIAPDVVVHPARADLERGVDTILQEGLAQLRRQR